MTNHKTPAQLAADKRASSLSLSTDRKKQVNRVQIVIEPASGIVRPYPKCLISR